MLSAGSIAASATSARENPIGVAPVRPDTEKEYAVSCAPKGPGATIFDGPNLKTRNDRLTGLVDTVYSFNPRQFFYVDRRQFASGTLVDGHGSVAVDLNGRTGTFYILTKDWTCSLFRY